MPKWVLAPAFAALKRMSFLASFVWMGLLFILPLAWCVWLLGPWSPMALPAVAVLGVTVLLVLLAFYALAGVYAYMSFGVTRLIRVTDRVAAGELMNSRDTVGDDSSNGDSSRLWNSILVMNDRLSDIVRQVRSSAEAIVLAARDISEGNHHLATRTQEQAASVEQTASGMQQLAASAQQNASDCSRAAELAAVAREVAGKAAGQMQGVAATMQRIDESARRVADILATVEGIAFQTNILALNAAVEAARAGAEGRGFAVVASEVRELARRSAEAAREIKGLIAQSVENVGEGQRMVQAAEGTMTEVVGSVRDVSGVIAGIATASREQKAGIEAINGAVVEIDSANQQNASLVEQASAAASSFEDEAARLLEVVSRFKIDRGAERGKVVAFVKKGIEHVQKVGARRACADFNDSRGAFVKGELYIFALDMQGTRLAFAPDPGQVGQNAIDAQDADGKYLGREMNTLARAHGSGWVDYKYLNPKSGRIEPKSVYIERTGDVVLGCGIYLGNSAADAPAPAARPAASTHAPYPRLAAQARR